MTSNEGGEQLAEAEPNVWDNEVETTDGPFLDSNIDSSSDSIDDSYDSIPPNGPVIDIEPHHQYVWKKTGIAPCSATCTRGNSLWGSKFSLAGS